LDSLVNILFGQLENMGFAGLVIIAQFIAINHLWRAMREERRRSEHLVDKMLEMTSDASIMIERITGRR
jgi:hypothetical protein